MAGPQALSNKPNRLVKAVATWASADMARSSFTHTLGTWTVADLMDHFGLSGQHVEQMLRNAMNGLYRKGAVCKLQDPETRQLVRHNRYVVYCDRWAAQHARWAHMTRVYRP